MDINDLKQLAASVEKELSESTATRVQVNIRLQEQKATLQAYKQKVKEVCVALLSDIFIKWMQYVSN